MLESLGLFAKSGGWVMLPLGACSVISWVVIFERWFLFRRVQGKLETFRLEASNLLLRGEWEGLARLAERMKGIPTAELVSEAIERSRSPNPVTRKHWREAVERERLLQNQALKRWLWVLATIATTAPFIGLAGTVIGILKSFGEIAASGAGGFAVVAQGISEALIATAAGIVVAIVAVIAFNALLTRWNRIVLAVRLETEEICEFIQSRLGADA